MIEALNLPKANLKLTRKNEVVFVWCILRKKKLVCTPEEWVRQHVIHFLIDHKNYPTGLISSEYSLEYNGMNRRADIVAFNRSGEPILIVECKATSVALTEKVLHQIAQYNFELDVNLLYLTNGIEHVVCRNNKTLKKIEFLKELPDWSDDLK